MMPKVTRVTHKPSTSDSVVDRIKSVKAGTPKHLNVLVYGAPGCGKTTFWATFPKPILAILVNSGRNDNDIDSIREEQYVDQIFPVVVQNTDELFELARHVETKGIYKTVVLDHVAGLQDMKIAEIKGWDTIPEQRSWQMANIQEWGECSARCKEMLRRFIELDTHFVASAHQREREPDESVIDDVRPKISPNISQAIATMLSADCGFYCHMYTKYKVEEVEVKIDGKVVGTEPQTTNDIEFRMRLKVNPSYAGKVRIPKRFQQSLPDSIADPTYDKLVRTVGKVLKEEDMK